MNRQGFRLTLGALAFAASGAAAAIGLGDLRGQLVLGDHPELSVSVLGADGIVLDAACFRLIKPRGEDQLPWLRDADLRIQQGKPPVLSIAGRQRVREPIIQVALHIACGHEVYREYTLFASPRVELPVGGVVDVPARVSESMERQSVKAPPRPPRTQAVPKARQSQPAPPREAVALPAVPGDGGDRLMLSAGGGDGESALRLDAVLGEHMLAGEIAEAQREILRLEYRMLAALHEQASSQLAAAEKLRGMEAALDELQSKTLALTEKAGGQAASTPPARETPAQTIAPAPVHGDDLFASWGFYGLLLGLLLGLAGWLFWRRRQQHAANDEALSSLLAASPEPVMDAPRDEELQEKAVIDLHLDADTAGAKAQVDVELEGGGAPAQEAPAPLPARPGDSILSINATTLDEHFEANPVMELADIMLSFGRVKGAAQALQEYVDNNPSEALQPWLRLMDVYRMAGMREEFDVLARNLNQQFNVEIQPWDVSASATVDLVLDGDGVTGAAPAMPKPQGVEEMPRIMSTIVRMWEAEDVVAYMYQLLRDNRGGQRLGFPLPVVEEILFLIELKETANRMEKEKAAQA